MTIKLMLISQLVTCLIRLIYLLDKNHLTQKKLINLIGIISLVLGTIYAVSTLTLESYTSDLIGQGFLFIIILSFTIVLTNEIINQPTKNR